MVRTISPTPGVCSDDSDAASTRPLAVQRVLDAILVALGAQLDVERLRRGSTVERLACAK